MPGKGRRWRAGTGLVLSIVAPALIVTACTADHQNSDTTRSGAATATSSSASKTPPPTATAAAGNRGEAEGSPGSGGGAGTGQTVGAQPGASGGTDTCGATLCGTTDRQPAPGALWDPCDISAADITEQGFRSDRKSALSGSGGVSDKSCRWQSLTGKSELTVTSTRQTVEEFEQSGSYVDFSPLSVGGRAAYQYRAAQDTNKIGCYVGIPVPWGQVAFVTRNIQPDAPEEPCAAARRLSGALIGYLP
ncbi:DUF3558 family protein [Nocardia pseudovaccinii]|uniref:DUF3558 family protein n=1 Tax=Nocardia pseudovaccinii TaxID=189540 RepID=UPI003D91A90F